MPLHKGCSRYATKPQQLCNDAAESLLTASTDIQFPLTGKMI
jgi:hypothetical protein